MDSNNSNTHQHQSLWFLSEECMQILEEFIKNMPAHQAAVICVNYQKNMRTEQNDGRMHAANLLRITNKYLFELILKIVEELRCLSVENYALVINYVHIHVEALRKTCVPTSLSPNFYKSFFYKCAEGSRKRNEQTAQPAIQREEQIKNNQVPMSSPYQMSPTNQCVVWQNDNGRSIPSAPQNSHVQLRNTTSFTNNNNLSYQSQNARIPSVDDTYQKAYSIAQAPNTYQSTLAIQPIWQMNDSNRQMQAYPPPTYKSTACSAQIQPNRLQTEAAQYPPLPLQNTYSYPNNTPTALVMQIGRCQQYTAMANVIQNSPNTNQMLVSVQNQHQLQPFSSYNCVNMMQNSLPILHSTDVAHVLQNIQQPPIETNANNVLPVSNSNNYASYQNNEINKINQSQLVNAPVQPNAISNNMQIPTTTELVPPTVANAVNSANNRKRSVQWESTTADAPQKKFISSSSNVVANKPNEKNNNNNVHSKEEMISDKNCKTTAAPTQSNTMTEFKNASKTNVTAPIKTSAAPNAISFGAQEWKNETENTIDRPRISKSFPTNCSSPEVPKSSGNEIRNPPVNPCDDSDDFVILVQTSTIPKPMMKPEKIEAKDTETVSGHIRFVDLCEDSNENSSDVFLVDTVYDITTEPDKKVCRCIHSLMISYFPVIWQINS